MAFEPKVAILDACVLYPFHLRNIIVQAAVDRLIEARWTDEIHNEWMKNLAANAAAIPFKRLQVTRRLMDDALPMATVVGYEGLIPTLTLPDPEDRHVVAAAIVTGASVILTWNLRDFPATTLKKYGLRARTPDDFLTGLYDAAPDLTVNALANARRNLNRSRVSASSFIEILGRQRLTRLAARLSAKVARL